jgi:hypothetical protein
MRGFCVFLIGFIVFFQSCTYNEMDLNDRRMDYDDVIYDSSSINDFDLWYIDIHNTLGYGEFPFIEMAYTLSFLDGVLYANNNLVDIGVTGNGYGIPVGTYVFDNGILIMDHLIDGYYEFEVYSVGNNILELYNAFTDTSYFVEGYSSSTFDYNYVFYNNAYMFLKEYEVWEKSYAENLGAVSDFSNENYLSFYDNDYFKSSIDSNIPDVNSLLWDYYGSYQVLDYSNNSNLKQLNLSYNLGGEEVLDFRILSDDKIELQSSDGQVFQFTGRKNIRFMKESKTNKKIEGTKREENSPRLDNPR